MSTTITASQTGINTYVTQQTSQSAATTTSAASATAGISNSSSDTITLSSVAQEMAAQATSWASMSQSQLQGIYNSTWNTFGQFDASFAAQGAKVFTADEKTTGTPAEIAFSKQVANYMVSIHEEPQGGVANPYAGASRAMVTSIMYDTSGKYTTSERYAAAGEQGKQDFMYLSKAFASAPTDPDHRKMYQGILDYYSALSPVETSVYPGGYREQAQAYLNKQESLFGVLSKKDVASVAQVMSTAFNENTVSDSALTSTAAGASSGNQSTNGWNHLN